MNVQFQQVCDLYIPKRPVGPFRHHFISTHAPTSLYLLNLLGYLLRKHYLLLHINPSNSVSMIQTFCSILEIFVLTVPRNDQGLGLLGEAKELHIQDIFLMLEKLIQITGNTPKFWVKARSMYIHHIKKNRKNYVLREALLIRRAVFSSTQQSVNSLFNEGATTLLIYQLKCYFLQNMDTSNLFLTKQGMIETNVRLYIELLQRGVVQVLEDAVFMKENWRMNSWILNNKLLKSSPEESQYELIKKVVLQNIYDCNLSQLLFLKDTTKGRSILMQITIQKLFQQDKLQFWELLADLNQSSSSQEDQIEQLVEIHNSAYLPVYLEEAMFTQSIQNILKQLEYRYEIIRKISNTDSIPLAETIEEIRQQNSL